MEYWIISSAGSGGSGIGGAIMRRDGPASTVVNSISIPSVDEFMEKVSAGGGKVIAPKTPIPGVGYFTYCKDTEGNTFGIIEEDESVKQA